MKPFNRNTSIPELIPIDQIQQTVERFGDDYALFSESDSIYRNAGQWQ